MNIEINNDNLKNFLKGNNLLILDYESIMSNNLTEDSKIEIIGIKDKTISLWITKVDQGQLKIEIKDCSFKGLFIEKSVLQEFKVISTTVSEYIDAKFKMFKTYIDKSKIQTVWTFNSTFYNGLLIRKQSEIEKVYIHGSKIDNSFTFVNSTSKEITVESSILTAFSIDRMDYPDKGSRTTVDKINIFRTEILRDLKIWETTFNNIHLHKIKLLKSDDLSDVFNVSHISASESAEKISGIKITESALDKTIIISVKELSELLAFDNNFKSFRLNFTKVTDFHFNNCRFSDSLYWGFQNCMKTIESFQFQNCICDGDFYLSDTSFTEKLVVTGTKFNKYPSYFLHNYIDKTCHCDFEYSNLSNFVFQNINFMFFEFKNLDISNAIFKDCRWSYKKEWLLKRVVIRDEKDAIERNEDLVEIKDIYANLKNNFHKNNDYLMGGLFNISEQEIKRVQSKRDKSFFEFVLLSSHKFISSYGENLSKPLLTIFFLMISLSVIYLFTGFYSGERLVQYSFIFDLSNIKRTLLDYGNSIIFSLKNIVPFSMNSDFFLHSKESLTTTQTIEFFQKIFNLLFVTSFTGAFIKYLKK
jgi:uncharacterized protein YjbI with pentapeptide repeats